jgi:apolipoprotein N-acyltransferase
MKKNFVWSAIASGILAALAFPPIPAYVLAFFAFVPLLMIFRHEPKHKYLYVYITFFFYHVGTNWWISSWNANTDPFLMATGIALDFLHPLFFLVPFVAFFFIQKRVSYKFALLSFPFLWTAFEWLHSIGDLGYSWLSFGTTQLSFLGWIQFIDITGVFGASFLLMWANVILTIFTIKTKESDLSFGKIMRTNKVYSAIFLLIIVLPGLYGFLRLSEYDHNKQMEAAEKTVNIGVVQPNFDPWDKWAISPAEMIRTYIGLQDSLYKEMEGNMDMAVWCETAIPYISVRFNGDKKMPVLESQVNSTGVSILTGLADFDFFDPEKDSIPFDAKRNEDFVYKSYNSAILLNPEPASTDNPQIHRKMHLTPFAERIPYYEYLSFMERFINWGVGISSWGKGEIQKNLVLETKDKSKVNVGPVICIESIFPDFVRKFTRDGANLITVITNDSWYNNTSGPEQHWDIARLRAIENRRYVARAANSGVSGFISADGKELARVEQYVPAAEAMTIPVLKEKSFYVMHGDWLSKLCGIISLIAIVFAVAWRIIRKKSFTKKETVVRPDE